MKPKRNIHLLVGLVTINWCSAQLGPEHRFAYPTTYPSYPENALAIHDMDGDGDGDVVFNSADRLWLYEQTTPGTYFMTADLGTASTARHFRAGDVDGDGIADLVFLEETPNRIAYLPILGGGAYGPITDLITALPGMIDLQLGDLDGDLDLDIVATREGTPMETFWCANDGNGAFGAPLPLFTDANNAPPHWNTFALADVDGDADLDLMVPKRSTNSVHLLRNDGGGLFTDLALGSCTQPMEIMASPLDDDPVIDLVVSAQVGSDQTLLTFTGNGDGTFGTGAVIHTFYTAYTHQLTACDIDDDGDHDLIFQWGVFDISDGPLVESLRNTGNGTFESPMIDLGFYSDSGKPFALGDLNGNGTPDLASTANDGLWVTLDGEPATASRINSLAQPKHVTAAQFSGSSLPDIVLSGDLYHGPLMEGTRPLQMALHTNAGGVVSESPGTIWQPLSGSGILGAYPADLDNDGDQDLLALWQEPWTGTWRRWCVFRNDNGAIDSTHAVGDEYFPMQPDSDVPHLGDLDNDGDLDLMWRGLTQAQETMGITTVENTGNGTFGPSTSVFVGTMAQPRAIGLCDVDENGATDYVWTMQDSLTWAMYDGNGAPGAYQFIGMAPIQADLMTAHDMDGNGSDDLLLISDDSVAFLFNDGNNGFITGGMFPYDGTGQPWPYTLRHEIGDLDGNGFPDLVAIAVNGDIGGPFTLITGPEHTGRNDIALADMDGDGDLDILTCSATGAAAWMGNDGMLPTAVTVSPTGTPMVLYPDPMRDAARLVTPWPLGSGARIELFDTHGRLVRTMNGNGSREILIERGQLPAGFYVLRVLGSQTGHWVARLVIH